MVVALLTAAGQGTRMHQNTPKQFIRVDDKPVIVYTMEAFQNHPDVDAIMVVTLDSWRAVLKDYGEQFGITKLKWVVTGGKTGQDSIHNGLEVLAQELSDEDVVMIHDGNRPMVSAEVISDSLAVFEEYGSAVATIPCADVVFKSDDGISSGKSIEREKLFRTQTPHTYRFGELLAASREAVKRRLPPVAATCVLMEELGKMTYFSKGSETNIKITTMDDLKIFEALLHTKIDGETQ